jgi:hypothetical protein
MHASIKSEWESLSQVRGKVPITERKWEVPITERDHRHMRECQMKFAVCASAVCALSTDTMALNISTCKQTNKGRARPNPETLTKRARANQACRFDQISLVCFSRSRLSVYWVTFLHT